MWSPRKKKITYPTKRKKQRKNKQQMKYLKSWALKFRLTSIATKKERTCPVCKTYSFSGKDDLYMNRFDCCYECYVDFVAHEEQRWADGWRPDSERLAYAFRRRKNGNSARDS